MADRLAPVRLTKSQVERLQPPAKGYRFLRDTELTGFLVRVTAAGSKAFCLEKRIKGRNVRKTIGRYPNMSVERARRQAHIWLGLLAEAHSEVRYSLSNDNERWGQAKKKMAREKVPGGDPALLLSLLNIRLA